MKILAFSDTHGKLLKNELIPEEKDYDAILIAGDIVPLWCQRYLGQTYNWLYKHFCPRMVEIMNQIGAKETLIVGGNHDFGLESIDKSFFKNLGFNNIHLIDNETFVLKNDKGETKTIYGFPYLNFRGWAYNKSDIELKEELSKIPNDLDVLLTHCPPFGSNAAIETNKANIDFGSYELREFLDNKCCKIKNLVCGHIHSGSHSPETINNTTIYNVSILDADYKLCYDTSTIII